LTTRDGLGGRRLYQTAVATAATASVEMQPSPNNEEEDASSAQRSIPSDTISYTTLIVYCSLQTLPFVFHSMAVAFTTHLIKVKLDQNKHDKSRSKK
jgi:hypothetical protein